MASMAGRLSVSRVATAMSQARPVERHEADVGAGWKRAAAAECRAGRPVMETAVGPIGVRLARGRVGKTATVGMVSTRSKVSPSMGPRWCTMPTFI